MTKKNQYYRLTPEGRALWLRRQKVSPPGENGGILGLVDSAGHRAVIAALSGHPAKVIDEWLAEFEALRLIEPAEARQPEPDDRGRLAPEVSFADISLTRLGVYVNHGRVASRAPSAKQPGDTVALVVEDDPDQLALAMLRLTVAGYQVRSADGVEALFRSLEYGLPDAIFLDIMLGDGDGFDALATLRRHPVYGVLPVLMVTAKTEPDDIARGLALGCDGYITKPYGANTLEYILRYVMKQPLVGAAPPKRQSALTPDRRISFSQRS